jgi:hypothetical protein
MIREPRENSTGSSFSLHRVLRPWGEGTKTHDGTPDQPISPGLGGPATAGDATWNDRFFGGGSPWTVPGGAIGVDYSGARSAELEMGGTFNSPYTFASDPALVNDVQFWLDHPESNFGWMLVSDFEDIHSTARTFASREDLYDRAPRLDVQFEAVPEPSVLVMGGAAASFALLCSFRRRKGA